MKRFLFIAFLAASFSSAQAQTNPGLITGQVLTAAQWNALFASKQDTLGYTPMNSAGGTFSGRVVTAAPGVTTASFNLTPGTTPGSPVDGDLWTTASGLFVHVGGVTVGPLSAAGGASFAATAPLAVSFPAGVTTYALNFNATLLNSAGSLAVNLNNANTWTANQTFPANSINISKLVNISANRVLGSIAGGAVSELTPTQLTTQVNAFTAALSGAVNAPVTATGKFLRDDNTWQSVAGSGTVTSAAYVASTAMVITGTTPCTTTCTWNFSVDKATQANYFAGTSNKVPTTDVIYQPATTTSYGGTTTVFDFGTFINTAVTLTGNITTMTMSGVIAGKAGTIQFIQDATGSRTVTFNTIMKFPGGTIPALSTAANTIDILSYNCISTTFCQAQLSKDVRNP